MPCLGPADIERVAAEGLLNVPGAAAHVAGCAECATTIAAAVRAKRQGDAPTEQLGRYQILAERGRGAFGRVFEAYDPALDRRVAVKMIAFTRDAGPEALAELLREAKAMAQIQHANVLPIFDAGRADDAVFITMPIVDGETLDTWAARERRNGIDAERVLVSIGRKIAAGLAAIHAAGFVHRDIKPSNILIAGADAFVADLGLARRTTRSTANTDVFAGSALLTSMHTASFAGTPAYMAPECLGGEAATPAADQYALAATLVEAITGERPFTARTYWALHEAARTRPPRLAGVPKRYHAALSRALDPDPAKRYASIAGFSAALARGRATVRGGAIIAVAAITPALVVGAGWWWTTRGRPSTAASITRDAAPTDAAPGDAPIDASIDAPVDAVTVDKPRAIRPPSRAPAPAPSPIDASVAPGVAPPQPPVRTCASAEDCRTTWMRCKSIVAASLPALDQVRKRGWAECAATNTACKTTSGVACSADLTRCNAAVAADYERGSERVQHDDDRCLEARNECLACK